MPFHFSGLGHAVPSGRIGAPVVVIGTGVVVVDVAVEVAVAVAVAVGVAVEDPAGLPKSGVLFRRRFLRSTCPAVAVAVAVAVGSAVAVVVATAVAVAVAVAVTGVVAGLDWVVTTHPATGTESRTAAMKIRRMAVLMVPNDTRFGSRTPRVRWHAVVRFSQPAWIHGVLGTRPAPPVSQPKSGSLSDPPETGGAQWVRWP